MKKREVSEILSPFELELIEKYKMLEQKSARPKIVVDTADAASIKRRLIEEAQAREIAEKQRFEKGLALKKLKSQGGQNTQQGTTTATTTATVEVKRPSRRVAEDDPVLQRMKETEKEAQEKVDQRDFDPEKAGPAFADLLFVPFADLQSGARKEIDLSKNAHLVQNEVGFFVVPLDKLPVYLEPSLPRKKYTWVSRNKRSTHHWGLRKLVLQEIDFLVKHAERGMLVVYAGGAPGLHMNMLCDMFPELSFLIIDSAPFRCRGNDRLELWRNSDPFSEEVLMDVLTRKGKKILISDIRTAPAGLDRHDGDQYVVSDLEKQLEWHERLGSETSLLKFRLPWTEGSTSYLDGMLQFPCYGPQTTTETRLIVHKGAGKREYDHKTYEEQMFYFNRMVRVQYYQHQVESADGDLDHCFDCARSVQIFRDYLTSHDDWYKNGERDASTGRLMDPIPEQALWEEIGRRCVELTRILQDQGGDRNASATGGDQEKGPEETVNKKDDRAESEENEAKETATIGKESPQREGGTAVEEEPDYGLLLG